MVILEEICQSKLQKKKKQALKLTILTMKIIQQIHKSSTQYSVFFKKIDAFQCSYNDIIIQITTPYIEKIKMLIISIQKKQTMQSKENLKKKIENNEQFNKFSIKNKCIFLNKVVNELIYKKQFKQIINKYELYSEDQQKKIYIRNNNALNQWQNQKTTSLQRKNLFDEELQQEDQTIQENPEDFKAYNNKAIALENLNRYEEALQYYDYAIQKNPEDFNSYINKANTLKNLNRYEDALQFYDYAIQKNPEDFKAYNNKAIMLKKLNRFEEALKYYDYAIQKNPEDIKVIDNKAIMLTKLNRFEVSTQQYQNATSTNSNQILLSNYVSIESDQEIQ